MTAYILTAEAESDLRSVIRYTRTQWGAAQVRRYVSGLERGIATLAEGKGSFEDMSVLHPALRMARCQHHYVFCLPREDAPALIVAILHERMDLMKRLVDRLNE
ncbi:type II toxin-antitoxin system RelE/ParE family toxin [Agrobacterium radiobacter]|uniref:Toxin ParE n=1 Tax=Agrobacterium tumefaciens str. B6 TaxID=1183423 RepID=A0A822V7M9_AGRTU|nr:type II toxin-antitoxin system RelE/ParE family toxin [Agrobacterium tumefaciens]KWT85340.1 plasmid stabilization protein ParE [Agrobacterium tumefaciens str. B6]MQB28588.1 type II toxin-antitoxin system RelE/ParE family toxin [Agrobacterium tumefaciens]NTA07619.1 type II toxin-antitoxin system RelE/ParE family toxin [Agrobacterium tumefaciens]NTA92825.1 type II toxin-antitoxin system RelE/ParE family toxin [Agrobacterium tumefaciens]NTB15909.1 type II toxin-antitoxin system RelE/ParE famil